jgi:hypothetical protein
MSSDISQASAVQQASAAQTQQAQAQTTVAQQASAQTTVAQQASAAQEASAAQQTKEKKKERNPDLMYLSNPIYLKKDTNTNTIEIDKEQCSFYKKRIIALTKEMLKGKYPSTHLERLHKEYIYSLINHFKKVDEVDILQSEYSDISFNIVPETDTDATTKVAFSIPINNEIMMKKNRPVSIDDFIVKTAIHMKTEIPPPQLKVINVTTSAHKMKGVAPKQHKDKI